MSIWSSIQIGTDFCPLDDIPERDNYTGEELPEGPGAFIDVATAVSWHELVRFSLDTPHGSSEVMLTADECRHLIELLNVAITRIEGS